MYTCILQGAIERKVCHCVRSLCISLQSGNKREIHKHWHCGTPGYGIHLWFAISIFSIEICVPSTCTPCVGPKKEFFQLRIKIRRAIARGDVRSAFVISSGGKAVLSISLLTQIIYCLLNRCDNSKLTILNLLLVTDTSILIHIEFPKNWASEESLAIHYHVYCIDEAMALFHSFFFSKKNQLSVENSDTKSFSIISPQLSFGLRQDITKIPKPIWGWILH